MKKMTFPEFRKLVAKFHGWINDEMAYFPTKEAEAAFLDEKATIDVQEPDAAPSKE